MQDNADRNFFVVVLIFWGITITDSVYPALSALVGSRMPDYRGIFLRGHGSQTSTHYGTVVHSSVSLGGLQGMVFGRFRPLSIQGGNMEYNSGTRPSAN